MIQVLAMMDRVHGAWKGGGTTGRQGVSVQQMVGQAQRLGMKLKKTKCGALPPERDHRQEVDGRKSRHILPI
jgi:hypothetical protein